MALSELHIEQEVKKANEDLKKCQLVEAIVQSDGWKTVIEPLIDKTIMDVIGGKVNGKWYGGLLDRARKDERREFYIGYKQALVDLHARVMAYVKAIQQLKDKVDTLKRDNTPKYKLPLVDDTRYNV
jgi:hypothetical protein